MSERLSEEELRELEFAVHGGGALPIRWAHVQRLVAEIRAHRAAALTEGERATLRRLRDDALIAEDRLTPSGRDALALLDKLAAAGGGK